jgi:glycerophosphoryl diester phosphodiesterase
VNEDGMNDIPPRPGARPLVLGHRGASADAPENTNAAFRLALQQGADGFELDVWRCLSGEVVVVHDADTARTTGVRFAVARTPWKQLQRLDAGAWFGEAFAGQRIPLLHEVLDGYPRAIVNVELKSDGAGDPLLALEVARIVRATGSRERVVVSSFDPLLLTAFRVIAPRVRAGMLFASDQRWRARAAFGALLGAALHAERSLVTPERAAQWRRGGRPLRVWTADEPEAVEALCAMGVDAVISNRPGVAREAVRRATGG